MPIIESSITVNRSAREVYDLLKNMEAFPRFISGVEQIKVRRLSKTHVASEWSISVEGTKINWKEKDVFDDDSLAVKFKMTEGDFASYSGEWRVLEDGIHSRLSFIFSIDWELQHLREEIIPELERKARLATRWMLREIRKGVGLEKVISQESLSGGTTTIVSELVTYTNERGQRIVAFFDHLKEPTGNEPFVVVPPGYGETKRDGLSVAYYLVKNGFNVIRYDATDHIGESDGEIINTTLSGAKNDLVATLNYLESHFGISHIGVVASSLAKRVAIKAAAEDKRIVLLIGLVGVVDLRETLKAVYKEDMIGTCLEGKKWGLTDVLGFEVSGRFLETAISDRFHDLETTREDFKRLDIPVVFLVAENDTWVRFSDVKLILESTKKTHNELHVLPEALHQLQENPQAAKVALHQIIASCSKYLRHQPMKLDSVIEPNPREIALQNKIEKERLKGLRKITKKEETAFWNDYLAKYFILIKSPDYKTYLKDISQLLGDIKEGDSILDAGCGNGHFGAWLLTDLLNSQRLQAPDQAQNLPRFTYVGVDVAEGAIREARHRSKELLAQFPALECGPAFHYYLSDLEAGLPFPDNTFSKICCSLVVSYVEDALSVLKELMRILLPRGRIVVTSLKPYHDLSLIYRNFIDVAETEMEIIEGRRLLSSAGKIRQKEAEGRYQFFTKQELMAVLMAAGGRNIQSQVSFGNQANIAAAQKGGR